MYIHANNSVNPMKADHTVNTNKVSVKAIRTLITFEKQGSKVDLNPDMCSGLIILKSDI